MPEKNSLSQRALILFVYLLFSVPSFPLGFGSYKKVIDPTIDDPTKPWCYLAKSTTVIGVPCQSGYIS